MVSGAAKKKKKRQSQSQQQAEADTPPSSATTTTPPCPPPPPLTPTPEYTQTLTKTLQQAHDLHLTHTHDKGRILLSPPIQGFEPGKILFEEHAYIHGNAEEDWCLECDVEHTHTYTQTGIDTQQRKKEEDDESVCKCARVRELYPPEILRVGLPEVEEWMIEKLQRVQTLDRARAWLKVCVCMCVFVYACV